MDKHYSRSGHALKKGELKAVHPVTSGTSTHRNSSTQKNIKGPVYFLYTQSSCHRVADAKQKAPASSKRMAGGNE